MIVNQVDIYSYLKQYLVINLILKYYSITLESCMDY